MLVAHSSTQHPALYIAMCKVLLPDLSVSINSRLPLFSTFLPIGFITCLNWVGSTCGAKLPPHSALQA